MNLGTGSSPVPFQRMVCPLFQPSLIISFGTSHRVYLAIYGVPVSVRPIAGYCGRGMPHRRENSNFSVILEYNKTQVKRCSAFVFQIPRATNRCEQTFSLNSFLRRGSLRAQVGAQSQRMQQMFEKQFPSVWQGDGKEWQGMRQEVRSQWKGQGS